MNLPGHRLILCFMYCINVKIFRAYWARNAYYFCIFPWTCHCSGSIHPVSVTCHLSVVFDLPHIRVSGIVLTLCVYCLLYLLWRTFSLNILFQFNCIIFFNPRLCKILYTSFALESSCSFLPCYPHLSHLKNPQL